MPLSRAAEAYGCVYVEVLSDARASSGKGVSRHSLEGMSYRPVFNLLLECGR